MSGFAADSRTAEWRCSIWTRRLRRVACRFGQSEHPIVRWWGDKIAFEEQEDITDGTWVELPETPVHSRAGYYFGQIYRGRNRVPVDWDRQLVGGTDIAYLDQLVDDATVQPFQRQRRKSS